MTASLKGDLPLRWAQTFHGPDSLADDLGSIGIWVGLRTLEPRRKSGEKEDWALRRLLVAWKHAGPLEWPFEIEAAAQQRRWPDFTLRFADHRTLGLEMTELGSKEDFDRLMENETFPNAGCPVGATERSIAAFDQRILDKNTKYDSGHYRSTDQCDLVINDQIGWGNLEHIRHELATRRHLFGRFRFIHFIRHHYVYLDFLKDNARLVDVAKAYEINFAERAFDQIEQLRKGNVVALDDVRVAEMLADFERAERNAMGSHRDGFAKVPICARSSGQP